MSAQDTERVMQLTGISSSGLPLFLYTAGGGPVLMASLAACSLAFSAGPRRAWRSREGGGPAS